MPPVCTIIAAIEPDKRTVNPMEHNILIPLLLTLGAGLATGIGSAIVF